MWFHDIIVYIFRFSFIILEIYMLNFFLIAGISYLFFALTLIGDSKIVGPFAPALFLIFSFPHFMATYWVWISRVKSWKDEWLPLFFPMLYLSLFLVAVSGRLGDSGVEVILKCSYLYLLYHFAQQLYGVTVWLNFKAGVNYSSRRKSLLRWLFLVACFYSWTEMEMRGVSTTLFYHSVSSWNLHSNYIFAGFISIFALSCIMITWSFFDYFKTKNLNHLICIGPIGLAWLWFIPPLNQNMLFLLPFFHGVQYLPFIFMKNRKLSPLKWVVLFAAFIGSGWLFFRWLPISLPLKPLPGTLWPAMILSLLNNHHFLIDGRIWKLRDPENKDLLTT